MNKFRNLFISMGFALAITFTAATVSESEMLSDLGLFHRCYSQITQLSPYENADYAAIAMRIQNGGNPVDECLKVFDRAAFVGESNKLDGSTDKIANSILNTFHQLHFSWFSDVIFPEVTTGLDRLKSIYDPSGPALYYLKALFGHNVPAKYVWTSTEGLRAVRTIPPTDGFGLFEGTTARPDYIFGSLTPFPDRGEILGVRDEGATNLPYYTTLANRDANVSAGSVAIDKNFGLGAFGSSTYLLQTIDEVTAFKSDGATHLPRRWARRFLEDGLCRALPVVREEDVPQYLSSNAKAPEFRKATACLRCHATMDRTAATIRDVRYLPLNFASANGAFFLTTDPTNQPAEATNIGWAEVADASFNRRPTNGVFYFRDYQGNLKNIPLTKPADVGTAISGMDDPYICMAKRYYAYFYGVDVRLADPFEYGTTGMTANKNVHLTRVINLGISLKNDPNQSIRKMIETMLRDPEYRKINFGVEK